MLTNSITVKKSIKCKGCDLSTGVIVKSKYMIKILNKAQSTFNVGEDSPYPIGRNFKSIGYSSSLRYKVVQ